MISADKKVLVDPHPFWGGWVVGLIAGLVFAVFAAWIVVQRVRQSGRVPQGARAEHTHRVEPHRVDRGNEESVDE